MPPSRAARRRQSPGSAAPSACAVVAAAGRGVRLGPGPAKALREVLGEPLLVHTLRALAACPEITGQLVVVRREDVTRTRRRLAPLARELRLLGVIAGGRLRQESVIRGLRAAARRSRAPLLLVQDAARPLTPPEVVRRTLRAAAQVGAALAACPVTDTIKRQRPGAAQRGAPRVAATLPRAELWAAQTPQAFRREVILPLLGRLARERREVTDDAAICERFGRPVALVESPPGNFKVTRPEDLDRLEAELLRRAAAAPGALAPKEAAAMSAATSVLRVGIGYDIHALVPRGKPLVLGGVRLAEAERGVRAHSDGDALAHALIDALYGAAGLGDIGRHFPDTSANWRDADSLMLLAQAGREVRAAGWMLVNADTTVFLERPRLKDRKAAMRANLARALGVAPARVNVKAASNEGLDAIGRGAAVAAEAAVLLERAGSKRRNRRRR